MYRPAGVKTSPDLPIPDRMKAWVLSDPDQLLLRDKLARLEDDLTPDIIA